MAARILPESMQKWSTKGTVSMKLRILGLSLLLLVLPLAAHAQAEDDEEGIQHPMRLVIGLISKNISFVAVNPRATSTANATKTTNTGALYFSLGYDFRRLSTGQKG